MKNDGTKTIPFSLYVDEGVESRSFWHCCDEMINVVLALQGDTVIRYGEKEVLLPEGSLLLFNRYVPFVVRRNGTNAFLIFKLDSTYFNRYYQEFSDNIYKENGINGDSKLRELIAKLVLILKTEGKEYRIHLEEGILQIALELLKYYTDDKRKGKKENRNHIERIASYIGKHYQEPIMLSELAEYVHLNEQYLSRHFSNLMGITISEYITLQRLYHSLELLKYTNDNIMNIALQCGFANAKSYYKACRKHFDKTPSQYRNEQREKRGTLTPEQYKGIHHQVLEKLYCYIAEDKKEMQSGETIIIDTQKEEGVLHKVWNKILAFGKASDGLKAEMRNQLKMVQQEIPFQYVRFHGIFSDDMMVYHEDEEGNAYYNFNYVDELIDFLREISLKPFIELGYMPDKLSAEKKYLFAWRANIGEPKELYRWENLVQSFLTHLIERYGKEEVRTWYFEIWNDPDLLSKLNPAAKKVGFPFLKATYECVKKVDEKLIIGGINTFSIVMTEKLIKNYFQYLKSEKIVLDFISLSSYGVKNNEDVWKDSEVNLRKNGTSDFFMPQKVIQQMYFQDVEEERQLLLLQKEQIRQNGFSGEFIINEWNLVPDPREVINDTCFKGAYFASSMLGIDELVNAVAYWTFSDIFEEVSFKEQVFHGGIGFITRNGLKKPVYYVLELLNALANKVIAKGDCFVATKSEEGTISILLFNYCRLKNYQFGQIKKEDWYSYFEEKEKDIKFILEGIEGYYTQNIYKVNREEGSIYDAWNRMGAPKTLKPDQVRFLKNKSLYHLETKELFITGNKGISITMMPHEVMLLELLPT